MKMKFNMDIFRIHYGKIYRVIGKIALCINSAAILWVIFSLIISQAVPVFCDSVFGILFGGITITALGILAISIFILPAFYCYYLGVLNLCKKQKQFIEGGKLHVTKVVRDRGRKISAKKKLYVIHKMFLVITTNRYITITGDISLQKNHGGQGKEIMVDTCKIPRCFTNEDEILKLARGETFNEK